MHSDRIEKIKFLLRARRDFKFFCKEVLGYKYDKISEFKDFTRTHDKLCDFISDNSKKNKLTLNPRYSFKSQICTVAKSLWDMVRNPNIRILIYSDTFSKAQGFLQDIKNHIEGKSPNSKFREYFPKWETDSHKGKWNESQIVVLKRKNAYKEPNVDTGGIETSKVGMHYDTIIFDDIVSDINCTTKTQMDKVYDCYKKSLSLLKPGGNVVIVGTRWHFGDTYGRILAENRESNDFDVFITSAEDKDENGKLIFDDIGLNREFLDYQKAKQGSYIYSCLYLNNPVSDETALFKEKDFQYYDYYKGIDDNMYKICAVDPSGEGEDYTAIVVVGIDNNKNIYLLEAINSHALCKPSNITEAIIKLNFKWKFTKAVIERNYYKGTLEEHINDAIKEQSDNPLFTNFSVESITASSKSHNRNRVLALQPYHEQGRIYFPGKCFNSLQSVYSELAFQMIQYTIDGSKSPHDDLIIAFGLTTQSIVPGGEPQEKEAPETSAVAIEREAVSEMRRRNGLLPRKYREQINTVFS